jgi:hypothetical protein
MELLVIAVVLVGSISVSAICAYLTLSLVCFQMQRSIERRGSRASRFELGRRRVLAAAEIAGTITT